MFGTTSLSELLKVPMGVMHYIEHKEENSQISLFEFIHIHYAHGIVHDEDYTKDMQLPFKTVSSILLESILFTDHISTANLDTIYYNKESDVIERPCSCKFSSFCESIWQPPKQI